MIGIALGAEFQVTGISRGDVARLFEMLGAALINRQTPGSGVLDHSVSVDLGTSRFEISVTTAAPTRKEAELLAEQTIIGVLEETGGRDVDGTLDATRPSKRKKQAGLEFVARELVAV